MTTKRRTPSLRPALRHEFEPHETDDELCRRCPAPELNRSFHPQIRFFRFEDERADAAASARQQLDDLDPLDHVAVIEEAWLWHTRGIGHSASDLEITQLLGGHRRATPALITQARHNLEELGILQRVPGCSFAYDNPHNPRTGRRHYHYARTCRGADL